MKWHTVHLNKLANETPEEVPDKLANETPEEVPDKVANETPEEVLDEVAHERSQWRAGEVCAGWRPCVDRTPVLE